MSVNKLFLKGGLVRIIIVTLLLLIVYSLLGILFLNTPLEEIKEKNIQTIKSAFVLKTESVRVFFKFLSYEGKQIASLSNATEALISYNSGKISLEKLKQVLVSHLSGAVNNSYHIVGIVSFAKNGDVILSVGKKFDDKYWIFPKGKTVNFIYGSIFKIGDNYYYRVLFPIETHPNGNGDNIVGYDLVFYNLHHLEFLKTSFKKQFEFEELNFNLKLFFNDKGKYIGVPDLIPLENGVIKAVFDDCSTSMKCNVTELNLKDGKTVITMLVKPFNFFSLIEFEKGLLERRIKNNLITLIFFVFLTALVIVFVILFFSKKYWEKYLALISELKEELAQKNRELEQERNLLDRYLNMAPFIYLSLDINGNIEYINDNGLEILEYSREEVLGKNWFDLAILEEERNFVKKIFKSVIDRNVEPVPHAVNSIRTKTGKILIIEWYNSYVEDSDGKIISVISTGNDVTKVKQEEQRFGSILKSLNAFLWNGIVENGKMHLLYYSKEVEDVTGFSREELLSDNPSWLDIVYEEDRAKLLVSREKMCRGESGEEFYRIINKAGELRWVRNWFYSNEVGGKISVTGFCMDRTSEIRLKEWVDKIIEALSSLNIGYVIYSAEDVKSSVIKDVNEAFERITGYSKEEVVDKISPLDLVAPSDIEMVRDRLLKRLRGEKDVTSHYILTLERKDKREIKAEVNVTIIEINKKRYIFTLFSDVTDKLREEENYIQQQKLEAIGVLTSGIAHDFNNILGGIIGWASLLETTELDEEQEDMVKEIRKASDRAASLVSKLLGFARKGKFESIVLDLNEEIEKVMSILKPIIKKDIKVALNLSSNLGKIIGDPQQIQQIIMNLCLNAVQAMPEGGNLSVTTENFYINEEFSQAHFNVKTGNYVLLSVEDTGIGMDEKTQRKIFDPFFTTKDPGEGTGLGLATVYGIVKNHGGIITVYSELGKGSVFKVYLPQTIENEISGDEQEADFHARFKGIEGKGTLLLIDDEVMILNVFSRFLQRLGYNVLTAEDGVKGVKIFKENLDVIDAVILDLNMPEMSGRQVFKRLKAIKPDVKVIIATGFAINGEVQEILDMGAAGYIKKPFDINELSHFVYEVLNSDNRENVRND